MIPLSIYETLTKKMCLPLLLITARNAQIIKISKSNLRLTFISLISIIHRSGGYVKISMALSGNISQKEGILKQLQIIMFRWTWIDSMADREKLLDIKHPMRYFSMPSLNRLHDFNYCNYYLNLSHIFLFYLLQYC